MYSLLLSLHSLFRWLVLLSLLLSISIAYKGWKRKLEFTPLANTIRHWTATIAHLQLLLGITIYFQSPVVRLPMPSDAHKLINEQPFFKYVHIILMLLSVVLITIGSAKAKRMPTAAAKYFTILIWFTAALLIIFVAIPWPFSPLANRPYIRSF
jgi:hypothetical protein